MLPFLAFSLPFRNPGYSPNCRDQRRSRRLLICLKVYLWWGLCTLYLLAYQVRVTLGDSGLDCCVYLVFRELYQLPCLSNVDLLRLTTVITRHMRPEFSLFIPISYSVTVYGLIVLSLFYCAHRCVVVCTAFLCV